MWKNPAARWPRYWPRSDLRPSIQVRKAAAGNGRHRATRADRRAGWRSVAGVNDIPQDRIDVAAPAPSGEDPVMADAGLEMATLHVGMRPLHNSCAANVWPMPQISSRSPSTVRSAASDCARIDTSAAPFEFSERQRVLLKHGAHGLQVESGG